MEIFAGISLVRIPRKFRWYLADKPYSQNSRETIAKLSVQSWKTWELDHLTPSWAYRWIRSRRHPENMFFTQKHFKNFEKHRWYKSLPKANKKNKNLFGLNQIWLSTYISHLNMYKHKNEIGIHWTLNLCVVCVDQVWNSP